MANPGAPAGPVFSIYQATGLGVSLNETLGTLVDNNVLTEFEAGDIVDDFDQVLALFIDPVLLVCYTMMLTQSTMLMLSCAELCGGDAQRSRTGERQTSLSSKCC